MTKQGEVKGIVAYWWDGWRRIFDFKGRSRRREMTWWILGNAAIASFLQFLAAAQTGTRITEDPFNATKGIAFVFLLVQWAGHVPMIVRRLHDVGESARWVWGWWGLLLSTALAAFGEVPVWIDILWGCMFVGLSVGLLYMGIQDSEPGPNRYGPNPKGVLVGE